MALFRKFPWSLVLAVALCALAWGVKTALEAQIGQLTPFLLFFGAVMIATWNGGLVVGVFAALLSACVAEFFFLPPLRSFALGSAGLLQVGVFLIESFFIVLLTSRARAAHDDFRAQLQRQSALAELSQLALARIDELNVVFERAAALCAQTLDARNVAVWELWRDDAGDTFQARVAIGPRLASGAKAPADDNFGGTRALRDGLPRAGVNAPVRGELNAPIGPIEKSWGVLQIGAGDPNRVWSDEQIEWVRALAGVLGVAIAGHQAREVAGQGETRYRSFVEQSSEAIWRFEMDEPIDTALPTTQILELAFDNGFLAECNDSFARMYGFEHASEMIGMRLWQVMDRDDAAVRDYLLTVISSDFRVIDAESHERDREGNGRIFLNSLTGIVENGRLMRVWGTQRDVTSQREAEVELKQSETRFRSLFDAAPVPLGIGRGQNVLYVNRALADLLGYDEPADLIGRSIVDFVAPEERAPIAQRALNRAAGQSEPLIYRCRVQKRGGNIFPARVEMAQITLPEGDATLMFLFDLTAQERADASIAQLLDHAHDATLRAQNLQEISFDLLRARAPEEAPNLAIDRVTRAVGARGGVLMAPDNIDNPQRLQTIGVQGYPSGALDQFFSIDADGEHPMAHVFRGREALWMDDAAAYIERFPSLSQTLPHTGTKSIAILPLIAEGRTVSVMALSWDQLRRFDEESRLFLQTLANSCAQTLEHARLDTQSRELARSQQESLALLNTLLESAPVGFALFDRDERYVLVNGALARMNGQPIEAHIGKTMRQVVPEPEPEFERRLREVWESGRASGEFVLSDDYNGEPRFCLVSLYPVRVERDGEAEAELLGVGALVIEITERVRGEEEKSRLVAELEDERARLEAILQQMPSGVVIAQAPSGRLILSNSQVENVLGVPYVAADSIDGYAIYHGRWPDGTPVAPTEWPVARSLMQGEIIRGQEIFMTDAQGETRVVSFTTAPIRDREGHISAAISIFDDVTQRARDEAAQRFLAQAGSALIATLDAVSAHERLANLCVPEVADWCVLAVPGDDGLLHNASIAFPAPNGGSGGDEPGENAAIARRFRERLGHDPRVPWDIEGALSSGHARLYPSHDLEHLRALNASEEYVELMGAIEARSAIVAPMAARGRTVGLMIWLTTGNRRLYDEHDVELAEELARRAALTIDNARLFQEAQQARDEAQSANLAKDEFLAVVSHELRTPLTPILGWLDLLRAPGMTDELRVQAYDVIERNARAQAQLVNDILDVSRITSGKLRLNLTPHNLTQLVRDAVESLRLTADEKGVELKLDLREVGEAAIDASRFQQVVWNLMSNAIKFTPAGGEVSISLERADDRTAVMQISDSGQGIAPDFVPNVFDAFRQADSSSTRKAGGLGLGLAIVRHIVELHGGQVSAHSEGEGHGATFRVQMPLIVAESPRVAGAASAGDLNVADAANRLQGARILLIDDEADTRETLARLLEANGARVRVAASAAQALGLLESFTPQLAISDIGMPEMDGYQLLSQMRARLPELPAIALTAYAAPADIERARAAGFQRHLAKPVEASALIEASGSLLGG